MSKRLALQLTVLAVLISLVSIGTVSRVFAQKATQGTHYHFDRADIRSALREVFKTIGASYTIDPKVKGTVTMELANVSFETVLQTLLRQVDATYRIEGGVYEILKRNEPQPGVGFMGPDPYDNRLVTAPPVAPPTQMIQDGRYIYVLVGKTLEKVEKSSFKIVKTLDVARYAEE